MATTSTASIIPITPVKTIFIKEAQLSHRDEPESDLNKMEGAYKYPKSHPTLSGIFSNVKDVKITNRGIEFHQYGQQHISAQHGPGRLGWRVKFSQSQLTNVSIK